MTRTDAHSPKNLVTEDYEFAYCGVHNPPEGSLIGNRWQMDRLNALLADGWRFADVHGSDQCSHCGTRINYYAVLMHVPSHKLIHVGETCLDNRFERATAEFHALRAQAQLDRQAQRIVKLRAEFVAAHEELCAALDAEHERGEAGEHANGFLLDLRRQLQRKGELSERQVEAALKAIERDASERQRREDEAANEPPSAPVVEGKIVVEGVLLATRSQEGYYGGSVLKMLVRDDRGFKVWGTKPEALYGAEKGDRVRFTATVERSHDDETFGFFKRPTKAEQLDAPAPAEVA